MLHILLTSQRTGSTFLQKALDSHPQIYSFGEFFAKKDRTLEKKGIPLFIHSQYNAPQHYFNYILKEYNDKPIIFKLMYFQLRGFELLPYIVTNKIPIVHLIRKDREAQARSQAKLGMRFKDLNSKARSLVDYDHKIKKEVRNNPYIQVTFENLFGPDIVLGNESTFHAKLNGRIVQSYNNSKLTTLHPNVAEPICKFLGVPPAIMYCNIKKAGSE